MKDKYLILEKVRKDEAEIRKKLRPVLTRHACLAVGFGLAVGIFLAFAWRGFPFPVYLVPLIVGPLFGYFGYRSWVKKHFPNAEKIIASLEKEPQTASGYARRADILFDHKFYEAAVDDYRTALAMPPDDDFDVDFTWLNLAAVLQKLDRNDEALVIVEKLNSTPGKYRDLSLVVRGELLADKDPTEALKCFDKAIEIEPNGFVAHLARLRFYLCMDQLDRAAEAVTETTKLLKRLGLEKTHYAELFELQGMLAMKEGRFADAVKALTWAIRQNPAVEKYYQLRSDAHEALRNIDKAEKDRRKVKKLGIIL